MNREDEIVHSKHMENKKQTSPLSVLKKLPTLTDEERGKIALHLLINEESVGTGFLGNPHRHRLEIIRRAKELEIDPNKLLSYLQSLLAPQMDLLFQPITLKDITEFEAKMDDLNGRVTIPISSVNHKRNGKHRFNAKSRRTEVKPEFRLSGSADNMSGKSFDLTGTIAESERVG